MPLEMLSRELLRGMNNFNSGDVINPFDSNAREEEIFVQKQMEIVFTGKGSLGKI